MNELGYYLNPVIEIVSGASVPLTLIDTRLLIRGRIDLVDGITYALEVATVDAPAAILAFGAARQ